MDRAIHLVTSSEKRRRAVGKAAATTRRRWQALRRHCDPSGRFAARATDSPVTIDVATFKTKFGLTRKHAIPLLEWLDRERVTRRMGDVRIVL